MRRATLCGWILALIAAPPSRAEPLLVNAEPAVALPNGGALIPFRLADSSGTTFPVRAGEISVDADDGSTLPADLVHFEGEGAEPFRIHLLVDGQSLSGLEPSSWAEALAGFAREGGSQEERAIFGNASVPEAWTGPAAGGTDPAKLREELAGSKAAPLWDGVLRAIDHLAAPGLPARRVLLVITDGEEEKESRHPVATCADAADTARVSVWVLSPRSPESAAARARLRLLASRSGGEFVDANSRGASALGDILRRIRRTQAVRLASIPAPPPLAVTLRPGVASAVSARVWIRSRNSLGLTRKPFPWLAVGGALVVAAAAGGLVLRRNLAVGAVRFAEAEGEDEEWVRVTRSGLTIGAAAGNGFVVAHPRVSRNHAVIRCEKGRAVLADLRSANGTKVNGRKISTAALRDGDRIVLADSVELIFVEGFGFGKRR